MRRMTSRQRILLGCLAMALAILGDYLLGMGTISMSQDPEDAYLGLKWNVVSDARYALSSLLGFASAALFDVAATELMRVMENRCGLGGNRWYRLFCLANWGGILYFTFIHIGICMLMVVFNAAMAVTGDIPSSVGMAIRVLRSIAVPLLLGFIVCDGFACIAWIALGSPW